MRQGQFLDFPEIDLRGKWGRGARGFLPKSEKLMVIVSPRKNLPVIIMTPLLYA